MAKLEQKPAVLNEQTKLRPNLAKQDTIVNNKRPALEVAAKSAQPNKLSALKAKPNVKLKHNLLKLSAWEKEKRNGAKIYRLTAHTTIDKIEKKNKLQKRQKLLQKIMGTMLILLVLLFLILKFMPSGSSSELKNIVGETGLNFAGLSPSATQNLP